jgi:hypothetical protein
MVVYDPVEYSSGATSSEARLLRVHGLKRLPEELINHAK